MIGAENIGVLCGVAALISLLCMFLTEARKRRRAARMRRRLAWKLLVEAAERGRNGGAK